MKKKKNIFKTLGLFASACLVCSGGIFLGSLSQKEEFISNNVSAYAELPQSSTAFLSTENITNSYIFINEHETEKS